MTYFTILKHMDESQEIAFHNNKQLYVVTVLLR